LNTVDIDKPWLGGEMELNPEKLCTAEATEISWPFKSYHAVTTGRTGLKLIVQVLKKRSKRVVLLPAYLCPSVLQPFREESVAITFYQINEDLSIDLDSLMRQVGTLHPSGFLFINYFGFPVSEEIAEALCEIKERCWVIEDCAQGSLVEQDNPVVGRIGDFVVTSFRKYLPVPDGGLVINRTDAVLPSLSPAYGKFVRYRLLGKLLRHEFLQDKPHWPELEKVYLDLFAAAERKLDTGIPLQAISPISARIFNAIDLSEAMARRRRNFSLLLKAFVERPRLQSVGSPVLTDLLPGVSPLAFPIRVTSETRDALREELIRQQVFCPIHWYLPAEIQESRFPESYRLSSEILSLPIDQRYSERDMESLIDRLLRAGDKIT